MGESNGAWGDLAEHDDELAEVWDGFERLPESGENDALDAFCAAKRIDIPALARLGTRLSGPTTLAFSVPGGIKFRDMETGKRWTYAGSEWTGMRIIRTGGERSATVIVSEGETDGARLSMLYAVDVAVLPGGAKRFTEAFAAQLREYQQVLVGTDSDQAGEAGLAKIQSFLPAATHFPAPANPDNDWCGADPETIPDIPEPGADPFRVGGLVFQDYVPRFQLALAGKLPPVRMLVDDLLYETGVHWISGHPAAGKSIVAMAISQLAMVEGRHVAWFDYENGLDMHVRRMAELGYDLAMASERFHYAWYPQSAVQHLTAVAERWPGTLVVIDSVSKALQLEGKDENSSTEVTGWTVPLIQAVKTLELPTIVIDHVTKSDKGDTQYSRGAGAKLADTDVHWKLKVLEPFDREHKGIVEVRNQKDRHGYLPQVQWLAIGDGHGKLPVVPCDGPEDPASDEPSL